ncbi:hypothetical protein ACJJID_11540 [Microbulbifer sp. CnH-101-G]|uniref:hypothetical protein n=1 Tax=Microbulbifer sp. CnH-101-G TaxID=3243393 RepID=UPI00403A1CAF
MDSLKFQRRVLTRPVKFAQPEARLDSLRFASVALAGNVIPSKESMDKKVKIFIGALVIGAIGMLSMVANYPKIYSPYSFTVVIPTLFASSLELPKAAIYIIGILPLLALYLVWSLIFIKPPFSVPKPTIFLAGLFIILSIAFNVSSYTYGIQYQGQTHTFLMYAYNIIYIGLLALVLKLNKTDASFNNSLGFNLVLFSWLGWVAFPWLGELI